MHAMWGQCHSQHQDHFKACRLKPSQALLSLLIWSYLCSLGSLWHQWLRHFNLTLKDFFTRVDCVAMCGELPTCEYVKHASQYGTHWANTYHVKGVGVGWLLPRRSGRNEFIPDICTTPLVLFPFARSSLHLIGNSSWKFVRLWGLGWHFWKLGSFKVLPNMSDWKPSVTITLYSLLWAELTPLWSLWATLFVQLFHNPSCCFPDSKCQHVRKLLCI